MFKAYIHRIHFPFMLEEGCNRWSLETVSHHHTPLLRTRTHVIALSVVNHRTLLFFLNSFTLSSLIEKWPKTSNFVRRKRSLWLCALEETAARNASNKNIVEKFLTSILPKYNAAFFQEGKFLVETMQAGLESDASLDYPSHPIYDVDGPFFDGNDMSFICRGECLREEAPLFWGVAILR